MIENFLQFLMGMVDSYLVAHLGLVALSGVAVANNLITIFQAIFLALGSAISVLLASLVDRQDSEKLANQAVEALKLTLLISLVLGMFSLLAGPSFLLFLGAEKTVANAGGIYLALVGGHIVFLGLMTSLGAILRALGKSQLPMYVSLLSNLLNALFSALGVFVFQAGILGVAVGTILARIIACFILWKQLPFKLAKPSWTLDRKLIGLAMPAAAERLMMRAGDVVVVALIVSLGTAVVAGNAVGETLTQFNYMPALGIVAASIILVARERGQENWTKIRAIAKASLLLSLLSMTAVGLLIFMGRYPLIALYTSDAQAMAAGQLVILYCLIGLPATAGTLIFTAIWQGLGNAKLPLYATTIGMWLVRIGLGYLFTQIWSWGLAGVWVATILDNVFRCSFLAVSFYHLSRKKPV